MPPTQLYKDEEDGSLIINHDQHNGWLECCWFGEQTKNKVFRNCRIILDQMVKTQCYKILTDNTHVTGDFDHSVKYISEIWFPELLANGLHSFAGVYSKDYFTIKSTEKAVKQTPFNQDQYIKLFYSKSAAKQWLRSR